MANARRFHDFVRQRPRRKAAAAALALVVAGPAFAQDAGQTKIGENPISVMMKWRPTTEAPDMPDFVKNSRPPPGSLGYTPVTAPEPARPARKSAAELAATVGKLEQAAAASRARAATAFPARKPIKRTPAPPPADEAPPADD